MRELLQLSLLLVVIANAATQDREPPRDCSDAPSKDIKGTCLMVSAITALTAKSCSYSLIPYVCVRNHTFRFNFVAVARNAIGHTFATAICSVMTESRSVVLPCTEGKLLKNKLLLLKKHSFELAQIRAMDRLTRRRIARQAARTQIRRQRQRPQGPARPLAPPRPQGPPDWLLPIPVPPNARGQVAYHPYDCMTLTCLCPFFAGQMQGGHCVLSNGVILQMAYRKEYRMMTEDERNRWHNALATLKMNGEYDRLSRQHFEVGGVVGTGSGAHSGPGFLPWHREYLKRFEIALRMVDPSVSIPYWDSVMDNYLPDPRDSMLFSNLFAGETDFYGNVIQGPFAYWRTLEGRSTILRNLGREGSLFNENQVNNVVAQNTIENVLAYTAPQPGCPYPNNYGAIEYIHSNVHLWVGGDMKPPSTSANEPLFFMHHSFVDYLWELWRQLKQPRWLREVAYSNDHGYCTNQMHFSWAYMRPFPYLQNRDDASNPGLSNSYTDQMYRYAPRPSCSFQNPNCGSPYLFCDTRGYPHCVAKIKMNGNCQGFENFDACYAGRCWWGRCIPNGGGRAWASKTLGNVEPMNVSLALVTLSQSESEQSQVVKPTKMLAPKFSNCYNRSPCCDAWAENGLCSQQAEYMGLYCGPSCGSCTPTFNISSAECVDLHPMCAEFKKQGLCKGKGGDFMAENCRVACGSCGKQKTERCYVNKKLVLPIVPGELVLDVQDSLEFEVKERVRLAKRHVVRRTMVAN
ncbi:shTK domain protein [Necator americanus]|uniref:ShTK domain protein n=1 Tax=Necator americanus TaxID=51031 RepID=W2SZ25_NECAM|nr:shTK domain protein [Necator americanus]ETN74955.1 shTK domain protein [Necator americanus]